MFRWWYGKTWCTGLSNWNVPMMTQETHGLRGKQFQTRLGFEVVVLCIWFSWRYLCMLTINITLRLTVVSKILFFICISSLLTLRQHIYKNRCCSKWVVKFQKICSIITLLNIGLIKIDSKIIDSISGYTGHHPIVCCSIFVLQYIIRLGICNNFGWKLNSGDVCNSQSYIISIGLWFTYMWKRPFKTLEYYMKKYVDETNM